LNNHNLAHSVEALALRPFFRGCFLLPNALGQGDLTGMGWSENRVPQCTPSIHWLIMLI
jgi:hypothetical protein